MPKRNEKDLIEIDKKVLSGIKVELVGTMDDVIKLAIAPAEHPPTKPKTRKPRAVKPTATTSAPKPSGRKQPPIVTAG